ncbi:ABC transporter ATP-binding protein [Gillisia marina]|uniref:ABC transporter ATP-binding protein n=1 Tax=Gillisia marina TaxID=1167637 RepID=UPI00029ADBE0|nr:ABC transporter ATP-binding protein [Gillisia marina]
MNIKSLLINNFQYFFYFYRILKYRIFISFFLSICVGVLDGFGLAMFIPLLEMSGDGTDGEKGESLGNLSFLPEFLESIGINLNITNALIIILVFFVLKGVAKFIEGYVRVVYQQYFMKHIRYGNIDNLNNYSFKNFVKSDVGKIQNTFSGEVGRVNMTYKSYFQAAQYGVLVLVYVTFAFASNAQFALMVSIGGVLTNFIFRTLYKRTKSYSNKLTKNWHNFQGLLIQHVSFFKYLKATGLNYFYGEKLKSSINNIEGDQRKLGVIDSLLRALREPLTMLVVVFVILIQVKFFDTKIGLIILSLLFLYRALTFLMALQENWNRFLEYSGSMDNLSEFTKELKSGFEKNGDIKFGRFNNKIELKNITFHYDDLKVIDGLNISFKKNETIAIIGESGSGKSTLLNILSGLFLPSKGEIFIDDQNIKKLDLYSYRNRIGYITQEAPIFSDTVFNNVTFWDEKNSENFQKFQIAIRQASIFDFVSELKNKEDEYLGNNGINISGGQKQRLSIARELYKDVDFLFMDEATSALDGETEKAIQKNIDQLQGKYTIFIIAHRLSTIRNADRIIVLKNGKIDSEGKYEDLLDTSTTFQEMIKLQKM